MNYNSMESKLFKSFSGCLKKYAIKDKTIEEIMKEEQKAIEERIIEKYKKLSELKDKR